jgi:hypothetical protein
MVATITTMRRCEKRQITDETTLLGHRKLTWTGSLLVLINAFAARSDP